jgi:cytochrome P450
MIGPEEASIAAADSASRPPTAGEELDIVGATALPVLYRLFQRYGDICRIYTPALGRHVWLVSAPEAARGVLVLNHRNYVKGIGIERVRILLGNGLMVSDGECWRRQRKMVQPAFHRTVLAALFDGMRAANERLLQRWLDAADEKRTLDVTHDVSEVTLEIVLRAIFGDELEALQSQGTDPFAILTQDDQATACLQVPALSSVPRALTPGEGLHRARFPVVPDRCRRPRKRKADAGTAVARRDHDADRRRARDDGERAELDVVLPDLQPRGRGAPARRAAPLAGSRTGTRRPAGPDL